MANEEKELTMGNMTTMSEEILERLFNEDNEVIILECFSTKVRV